MHVSLRNVLRSCPVEYRTSSCKINTTWFPFDEQICDIRIESFVYNGFEASLQLLSDEGADISSYVENLEWILVGVPAKRNVIQYEYPPEPYHDITYSIILQRRVSKYWSAVIIPQYLMALICLCAGFIPLSSPTPRSLNLKL